MANDTTEGAPAMDYAEHDQTYAGFMEFTKLTIFAVLNVLISLILFTITGAFWSGFLVIVLTILTTGLGIMMKGSPKPSIAVSVIGVLLFLLSIM